MKKKAEIKKDDDRNEDEEKIENEIQHDNI